MRVLEAGIWAVGLAISLLPLRTPLEAVAGVDAPMTLACAEAASLEAFSLIAFCLSSSLAKIGTRSSGIGLLSCGACEHVRNFGYIMGAYLEALAELDEFCYTLLHFVLHQCLLLLSEPLLFIGDEVTESRKRISRLLLRGDQRNLVIMCF